MVSRQSKSCKIAGCRFYSWILAALTWKNTGDIAISNMNIGALAKTLVRVLGVNTNRNGPVAQITACQAFVEAYITRRNRTH